MSEKRCPICGKSKKEMSSTEYNESLKKIGKKWEELDKVTQDIFKLSKYTFTCNCPITKIYGKWFEKARDKEGE